MKLTEAQRDLLARVDQGAELTYDAATGRALVNVRGFGVKVNLNTFSALSLRQFIKPIYSEHAAAQRWSITPAGRAALSSLSKKG